MLLQIALFHSFLWLSSIPLYIYTTSSLSSLSIHPRVPNPPGHGTVLVRGLLGTRSHSRRWAVGNQAKLHLLLPITHITIWIILTPPPRGKIVFHETGPWCQKAWGPLHSSVDGHLGCFYVLVIVNNAAVNIGVHVSFRIRIFSGYMPRSGIAGYHDNYF